MLFLTARVEGGARHTRLHIKISRKPAHCVRFSRRTHMPCDACTPTRGRVAVRPQLHSLHSCRNPTTHHLTNMPAHMHNHWHSVRQQHNDIVRAFIAGPHLVSLNAHLSTRSIQVIHSAVWSASGVYVCISVPPLVCGWCHRRHPSSSSMMRAIMSHAAHTGPPRRSCTSRGCTPPSIRRSGRPRRSVGRPRFTHHSSCPVIAVTRRVGRCRQLSTLELGGTHPPSLILRRAGRGPPRFHPHGEEKASSPLIRERPMARRLVAVRRFARAGSAWPRA